MKLGAIDYVPFTNIADFYADGSSNLAVGQKGAGKTTQLLWADMEFALRGETVVVWDRGEYFEWLDLAQTKLETYLCAECGEPMTVLAPEPSLQVSCLSCGAEDYASIEWRDELLFPLRIFLPRRCRMVHTRSGEEYIHPNIQVVEYDPLRLEKTLFNKWKRNWINIVMFDAFSEDETWVDRFRAYFLQRLTRWKKRSENATKRIALSIDEFHDWAPAHGKGTGEASRDLMKRLVRCFRTWRRLHIRLLAATHLFTDIDNSLRYLFDTYIFKQTADNPDMLPERLKDYGQLLRSLPKEKMIYVDKARNFNRKDAPVFVFPVQHSEVSYDGNIDHLFEVWKKQQLNEKKEREEEELAAPRAQTAEKPKLPEEDEAPQDGIDWGALGDTEKPS